MRGYDDVREIDEYVICKNCLDIVLRNIPLCNKITLVFDNKFFFENVEPRASHLSAFQSAYKRLGFNNAASGRIDEIRPLFHFCERIAIHKMVRILGIRNVKRNNIAPIDKFVERDILESERLCRFFVREGVLSNYVHPETPRKLNHFFSDFSRADDPDGFVFEIKTP